MGKCFVIQPFDKVYDKRYLDVLKPAIEEAGLEAYRVDQDPSVSVPIESIEQEIRKADACLADISTNNPNVWYELGYAFASGREVVLICSTARKEKYPFDVQHRHIIEYATESSSDFERLKGSITERLQAIIKKESAIQAITSISQPTEGLRPHEMAALVVLMGSSEDWVSEYSFISDMEKAGYTRAGARLSLTSLTRQGFIAASEFQHESGDTYEVFKLTEKGEDWLIQNQDRLELRTSVNPSDKPSDEEIPF